MRPVFRISKNRIRHLQLLILALTIGFTSSCKKQFSHQNIQEINAPDKSDAFITSLYQELLNYNKQYPVLDTVSQTGTIDWTKMVVRISSNPSKPFNFDLPVLSNQGNNQVIELSFSEKNDLVKVTLRRLSSLVIDTLEQTENERTKNILYLLSK
ncbi:hypothetical protein [Mucilaginibacter paludis]|uniref:Lipoprotein n=1 Tax=Mucilaginibacter paludis DSM 18603 TaxID=714943 RepID=H1Y604_9SPHI|nr:hypothetical protein [Mucilaginibacter paludis]EHQ30963.1 hypothetical protein Mucpa_6914 [Mucilaginibacter paludis DSM 18603]